MKDNVGSENPETGLWTPHRSWRNRTSTSRQFGVLTVLAVVAATALAACNAGGSANGAPNVASLSTTTSVATNRGTGGSATTTPTGGNPTQLLDEWAECMRAHGDPGQADPTIDASKVIHLTWNDAIPGGIDGTNKGGQGNVGPGQYCRTYIDKAETDLQGGQQPQPSQAQLLTFSRCMRANGIPDFPDPSNDGLSINRAGVGDLNPSSPVFQNASTLCAKKTGVRGFASGGAQPPGSIEFNGGGQGGADG